ncbi:hypothetical protein ACVWYH_009053 [Bradyrhizobium sp. GM24.11]
MNGSVCAIRSGVMKAHGELFCGERIEQLREALLEHPLEGAVIDGDQLLLERLDHEPHWIARRPARKARDDVLAQHRLAVMEFEP